MKKLILVIIALAGFTVLNANPLISPPPSIGFSELGFDSSGKWILEIKYTNIFNNNTYIPVDSIFISTSTGRAKLKNFKFTGLVGLIMVSKDSLTNNVTINPVGDSIQIEYFYFSQKHLAIPAIFGNFKNATLACPHSGQSIASYSNDQYSYHYDIFSIDKSPSFGLTNDSTGMCGTIKGYIYDSNNQLLKSPTLNFFSGEFGNFSNNADGSYSTRIFSNNKHNRFFNYYYPYVSASNLMTVEIAPINLNVLPDTVVYADIHFQKITAVNEVKSDPETIIQILPNPLKELSFNYQISIPVKSSNSYIELLSINGQRIAQYPITEDNGKINLPANTANGAYAVRLFVNNKNYATTKILIAK